jgi:valyl-tRNA synthetase
VAAEIARLEKENEKTAGFIEAKKRKLGDEKFAGRAPEAVVAKERAQLVELEAKLAAGAAALADLRGRRS